MLFIQINPGCTDDLMGAVCFDCAGVLGLQRLRRNHFELSIHIVASEQTICGQQELSVFRVSEGGEVLADAPLIFELSEVLWFRGNL